MEGASKMWVHIAVVATGIGVAAGLWLYSKLEKCRYCYNYATSFYDCAIKKDAKICLSCLDSWVWSRFGEQKGTAAFEPRCFNQCGAHLTATRLSQYMSHEQFTRYTSAVTSTMLSANPNVVWCPCGAIYEMDKARHGEKCLFVCLNCKKTICAGCGDIVDGFKKQQKKHECQMIQRKDGVKCPQCKAIISKTEGCNNMRCVICNTFFDYGTV
jgi:LSD1 subclass zinc finger protein